VKRFLRKAGIALVVIAAALWLNNTSLFITRPSDHTPQLIAHRGVHQIYAGTDRGADTCSSNPVQPLTHQFIANTLPSMEAAFAAGAQVVEIDVHLTTDGVFAVFHDWTLDCQTDGTGVTHEQDFAYLRSLDLGYGITEGDGEFPLRGTAGPMPSLQDVFEADLGGQYLINFKSNRAEEGAAFAAFLEREGFEDQVWGVYGGSAPVQTAIESWDGLRGFGRAELKACLFDYIKIGWSGVVPESCHNRIIAVPMDYGPWLWGWPHKFTQRMQDVGTTVILWGPYDGSGFSSGVDDAETLSQVPEQFDGFIWTNQILDVAPLLEAR
jgi:glycerophosphoryl diester phosphodiesterase